MWLNVLQLMVWCALCSEPIVAGSSLVLWKKKHVLKISITKMCSHIWTFLLNTNTVCGYFKKTKIIISTFLSFQKCTNTVRVTVFLVGDLCFSGQVSVEQAVSLSSAKCLVIINFCLFFLLISCKILCY